MSASVIQVSAAFPRKLDFLFRPKRYKVLYGGRGGIKSWSIARALLLRGAQQPLRIPCARETMQSIRDSVHQLLEDQIKLLNLGAVYRVLKSSIIGENGTEFSFHGLRDLNVHNIKSLEGADILWAEEAQAIREKSWETVIPTIRKPGSEIWVSFNPILATDAVYERFVAHPPPNATVVRTSYKDNPWLSQELKDEIEHCRLTYPDQFAHIWGGECVSVVAGAVYAEQLRAVEATQRITRVPYDPAIPVHTFWDLGIDDATTIWFMQRVGFEYRFIDYIEGTGKGLPVYLRELQGKGYIYGTHHLPHDGGARQLGTGKSIEELMRAAGHRVKVVAKLGVADGINAARTVFPLCWFDGEKCKDGLDALRHYHYGEVEELGVKTRQPIHDWSSHGADAYRCFAVGIQPEKQKLPQKPGQRRMPLSVWS